MGHSPAGLLYSYTGSAYEIGSLSLKPCLVGVIDLTNNFTATRSNVDVVNLNFTVIFTAFVFLRYQ